MAAPTLAYGGTTVTLPFPARGGRNDREYDERRTDKRTLAGQLRTMRTSRGYVYHLNFVHELVSTYDAIIGVWEAALAAGGYPTFTWSGGPWSTATGGVTVAVKVSPIPTEHDFTRADFTLELVEVPPR